MNIVILSLLISFVAVSLSNFVTDKLIAFCNRRSQNKKRKVFMKKKTLDVLSNTIKAKATGCHSITVSELEAWDKE